MIADEIREAAARAVCNACKPIPSDGDAFDLVKHWAERDDDSVRDLAMWFAIADRALAALPVTPADLADIAAGRAVVVPVEATARMLRAAPDRSTTREEEGGVNVR
jgi:hypothetical protein